MSLRLHFDTETNGLPNWKVPSDDESQPHIVQLAAIVVDEDTGEVVHSMNCIIKPDGWSISEELAALHGISQEYAEKVGIPEDVAVDMLIDMWASFSNGAVVTAVPRVCYNRTFDQRIIRIALRRFCYADCVMEAWANKDDFECAMMMAKKEMGVKSVKLTDAYKHYTGMDLDNAHSALADTEACREVYEAAKQKLSEKI